MAASTIDPAEISRFLDASRAVIKRATARGTRGETLLATPRDGLYPLVSTRDLAASIVMLSELGELERARQLCSFLLSIQLPTGAWAARYEPNGEPLGDSQAEDVTALAVWALVIYARGSGDRGFADQIREPVEHAARYTVERTLNPYLYLIETTSSLHGPTVSEGYELWNNCAHAAAFAVCHRLYGGERFRRLGLLIRRSIGLYMTQDGRFIRRLDRNGAPDPRPDVQLMAPWYFGLWAPTERGVMNSAELIERTLWNVEIGGYARFLPYSPAERAELPGPRPLFTAWMAQFHFDAGNKDRAETVLHWLFSVMQDGALPEALVPASVLHRYGREQRRELEQAPPSEPPLLAEARARALAALQDAELAVEETSPVALGGPLVWAHLETLRALKKGGHVERWEAEPTSPRPDLRGT